METQFAIADFEQQNKALLRELIILKVSLRCANRSETNDKLDADRAASKLKISEPVTFDIFEEIREVKKQFDEATSRAESHQSELPASNRTNIVLKQKFDEYDRAYKRFQESLNKNSTQMKKQTEIEKLLKQLQVMRVETDIRRAEAMQLIQTVDGKRQEELEKCIHPVLTYAENWDIEQHRKYSIFNVKRRNTQTRLSTIYYSTAYKFENDPNGTKKCARLLWPLNPKNVPAGENN